MESIKIVDISKKFKDNQVLQDVNLSCKRGSITGVIGRNGSGKTVLFKLICGFLRPDSGSILIENEENIHKYNRKLGIIIEEPSYLEHLSAYKNLEYLYTINNRRDKKHLYEILALVGLNPESHKQVGKYSMGMRQRLAIAQAIMENQSILILDEPFNGLDNQGLAEMRELLLKLKSEGKTILIASHNKEDIEILCEEVYLIDKGILVKTNRP